MNPAIRLKAFVLFITCLVLPHGSVASVDSGDPIVELPPYTVVSPVIDTVDWEAERGKVTRVSEEQIQALNAHDLSSALRRVTGVTVSRYGMVGAFGGSDGGAVFIRGHGTGRPGSEIVTLVDGIPRFVGVWSHPILDMVSVDAARTVEVYKSPQPVHIGNMGFGAVNAVSKQSAGEPPGGAVHASYGRHGTRMIRAEGGFGDGPVDGYFVASSRTSNGHRPNASGSVSAFYGHLGAQLSPEWRAWVRVHHNDGWARDPQLDGEATPVPERFATKATLFSAVLEQDRPDQGSSLRVYYDDGSLDWREWRAPPPPPPGRPAQQLNTLTDFRNYGLRARHHRELPRGWRATAGIDADSYGGETREVFAEDGPRPSVSARFRNIAPWGSVSRVFPAGEWELIPTAGLRYTHSREFGGVWGAQTSLQASRDQHTVQIEYARGFNLAGVYAAVFAERWNLGDRWQELDPEVIDHYEIGYQWDATRHLSVEASLFHDRSRNAIRFTPPPATPPGIRNFDHYSITGVDGTLRWRPMDGFHLFAGTSWLNPSRGDLPATPRWTTTLGAAADLPAGFSLAGDWQYVSARNQVNTRFEGGVLRIAPYALLNLRAAWGREAEHVAYEVFLALENALGRAYELRRGYPMPGRVATIGAGMTF